MALSVDREHFFLYYSSVLTGASQSRPSPMRQSSAQGVTRQKDRPANKVLRESSMELRLAPLPAESILTIGGAPDGTTPAAAKDGKPPEGRPAARNKAKKNGSQ